MQKRSGVGSGGDWESDAFERSRRRERWESRRGSVRHAFTLLVARELVNGHFMFIICVLMQSLSTFDQTSIYLKVSLYKATCIVVLSGSLSASSTAPPLDFYWM